MIKLFTTQWKQFPNSIRILLENQYIYEPYWSFLMVTTIKMIGKKFDLSKTLILKV